MNDNLWGALGKILTSPNATAILLFLAVCIIIAFVLIKSGAIKVHTNAVIIGAADTERNIIRQQLNYVMLHLKGVEGSLQKPEGYNPYLGKYIIERVYDEYVDWITFNHLSKSSAYIEVKQNALVDLVNSYTVKDEFKTDEFVDFIRKDTRKMILDLIQIREVYKSN